MLKTDLLTAVICYPDTTLFTVVNQSDFFQNAGKIYVVVAVLLIIFIGIGVFLFRLDQKVSKLEKHIKDGNGTDLL